MEIINNINKNKFYILSTTLFLLPQNGTHIISNRKFAKGFEQNGYEIVEILNDEDKQLIENNIGNIIILSNFTNIKLEWENISIFAKKYDNICYILWCWHNVANPPFKHFIYTFQHSYVKSDIEAYKQLYDVIENLKMQKKFLPYIFSSYIDPITDYKSLNNNYEKIYDILYIGAGGYDDKTLHQISISTKYKSFIHVSGGGSTAITGQKFEKLYRQSKICLGLMGPLNILGNVITERIWEALSFGTFILTNSKLIESHTNSCAVYYSDTLDCLNKLDYYLENTNERKKKITDGYEIFEKEGNYKKNVLPFIDHIHQLNC
jgi:hypothetical protein